MAILKCKMCGGDIELSPDRTFGTCDSCGSTMTFPKVDDEQRANMFNRGNHFRRMGEFDKALAVYERIVQDDENDAEAHWCCALCRFGIEYVEDPNTYEYLPTCHRASFDSFLQDVDYLATIEHSDGVTRRQYQKDAAKIAEVQRGILATSQNEEPFDVFICYKESENDGSRTRDSLMAQEIYYQLTEQKRRVFFSRITLEDKVGTEYEPYIFAALNSAKVMIVVTTSAEHVNAVWVKNEWSRFLSLMRKDRSKLLLPCYRDMDPYDLPEALSVLQSYDMSKIGFIQDLIRGINKVLDANKLKETVKETVVIQQAQNNVAPLLKRAFMFLEDGDFDRADEFCEQILNLDPENAEAYLVKLMAELHVKSRDALKEQIVPFDNRNNYKKALRFGNDNLKNELISDAENARKEAIYQQGLIFMKASKFEEASSTFTNILEYKDANALLIKSREEKKKAEEYQEILRSVKGMIAAGVNYTVGVKADNTVVAIGENQYGQCKVSNWTNIASIAAGYKHSVGLKTNGTVVAVGDNSCGQRKVSNWNNIIAINASNYFTVGLRADGTVVAVGDNDNGQCNVFAWNNIIQIATGYKHTVGLKANGTIVAVGNNDFGQCNAISWKDIIAITSSYYHTVGMKADGTVVAVGNNKKGQCNVTGWNGIVAITAGIEHTVGLKADGTVVAVGSNKFGQCKVSDWTDIVAIAGGGWHTVGLKADGTVVTTGENEFGQCDTSDWRLFQSIYTLYKEKLDATEKAKKTAENELVNLKGLFSNLRRKELEEQITAYNSIIEQIKKKLE